jgi:uncharacterized membrane protein
MSEQTKPRLPLWLIASLLVNALLIGLVLGGGLGQRKAGPPPSVQGSEEALMRGIDRTLPQAQRRTVRQTFRRAYQDTREERRRVREARRKIAQSLAADPYDREVVQAGFAELRAAESAMKARMQDLLAEQLGELTLEQRQAVLRDYDRRERRPRGRPGDRDRPPPPRPLRDRD